MGGPAIADVTLILQRVNEGQKEAQEELARVVNDELRALAERHMRKHFGRGLPGVTLQPTALVNETFLRLIKQRQKFDNRGHFFAIATRLLLRTCLTSHSSRG